MRSFLKHCKWLTFVDINKISRYGANIDLKLERSSRIHAQNVKKHEFLKISKARKTSTYKSFNGFKLFGFMLTKVDIFRV
ncbi:hypothetical protein B7692_10410 [Streptococcus mitis]|uniref:Uncharacterized protein n=1 Tax=Streptococcus mitis TaxID=28037 RepID=A0A1X1L2E2_STRMT|nr:hypothetical protein B7692_10410 [Streptococcus mitis]